MRLPGPIISAVLIVHVVVLNQISIRLLNARVERNACLATRTKLATTTCHLLIRRSIVFNFIRVLHQRSERQKATVANTRARVTCERLTMLHGPILRRWQRCRLNNAARVHVSPVLHISIIFIILIIAITIVLLLVQIKLATHAHVPLAKLAQLLLQLDLEYLLQLATLGRFSTSDTAHLTTAVDTARLEQVSAKVAIILATVHGHTSGAHRHLLLR
jgi:hypothetical protein